MEFARRLLESSYGKTTVVWAKTGTEVLQLRHRAGRLSVQTLPSLPLVVARLLHEEVAASPGPAIVFPRFRWQEPWQLTEHHLVLSEISEISGAFNLYRVPAWLSTILSAL